MYDPDENTVKGSGMSVIKQGGNVTSRLPGRSTHSATELGAGGVASKTVQDVSPVAQNKGERKDEAPYGRDADGRPFTRDEGVLGMFGT